MIFVTSVMAEVDRADLHASTNRLAPLVGAEKLKFLEAMVEDVNLLTLFAKTTEGPGLHKLSDNISSKFEKILDANGRYIGIRIEYRNEGINGEELAVGTLYVQRGLIPSEEGEALEYFVWEDCSKKDAPVNDRICTAFEIWCHNQSVLI